MLTRDDCHCLLIRAGGKPAGFALVAVQPFPHMPAGADTRMAEFFVAQPYRGAGSEGPRRSRRCAGSRGTGRSVVTNDAALAFWRAVTGEATGGDYVELERPGDTVQRFTIPLASRGDGRRSGVARGPKRSATEAK